MTDAEVIRPSAQPEDLPASAAAALATFLSYPSPRVLLALVTVLLPLRWWVGDWQWVDAMWAAAIVLLWPLNEWLIHVLLLHRKPSSRFGLRLDPHVSRKHRQHHRDPWHLPLVFIPIRVIPGSLLALLLAAWLLTPTIAVGLTALSVYLVLSLHYEWCHYLAHINWCPSLPYYRRRVRDHRLHHFRNERYWWGVSMGLGDRLLGTAPDPGAITKSATTATLGIE